jgi:hypothetical protein
LRDEFLNARGAIARFSRGAIEIRVLDVQESPVADLAVAAILIGVLKLLVAQTWSDTGAQQEISIEPLEQVFLAGIRDADRAVVHSHDLLRQFGITDASISMKDLWRHLSHAVVQIDELSKATGESLIERGPLARRIVDRLPATPTKDDLRAVYGQLADCLAAGTVLE